MLGYEQNKNIQALSKILPGISFPVLVPELMFLKILGTGLNSFDCNWLNQEDEALFLVKAGKWQGLAGNILQLEPEVIGPSGVQVPKSCMGP